MDKLKGKKIYKASSYCCWGFHYQHFIWKIIFPLNYSFVQCSSISRVWRLSSLRRCLIEISLLSSLISRLPAGKALVTPHQ